MDHSTDIDALVTHKNSIVNGVRLHYVEAGPADGELVVCLHGFPEFWYSWHHQIPALVDAGYRVVAPDMRGYNRSEKPHGTGAYRLEELTADIESLIHELGAECAHLVAHDWGGVVAWTTAYSYPDVVETLTVLNAPHPIKYARELSLEQVARSWYALYFQLPWLPERLFAARDFAAFDRLFREGPVVPDAFTDEDIERYKTAFRQPGALTSALTYYRAAFRNPPTRQFAGNIPLIGGRLAGPIPRVRAPTLVLWGEHDDALSVSQIDGLEEYVEKARVVRFPNASHWVQFDQPKRVNEQLLAFLESQ